MSKSVLTLAALAVAIVPLESAVGWADWPMWRYDTQRSAASPDKLPGELHLQWTRQLPPVRPAWPNEPRLHFDASYEPVVLGQRLFVASPNDGSVVAYATDTGEELWRFYADGPVRLAPVAFHDSVYIGSDDGYLYCLDAAAGKLRWKVRGAPEERRPYRHLGNGRLVSFWPVRGGPVLADDVVYFGAGIWPTLGIFVHAVDARSGQRLWTNADGHAIENVRIDHNYLHESGLSPQGHMLIAGDLLVVPNGRSMPARLDRATGRLLYFVQGYRNGDSRVTISGDLALVGDSGVVSLKDGREIASRWASAGDEAPAGWSNQKDLFEGPMFPYKFLPGCDHRAVLSGDMAYGLDRGVLYAYDVAHAATALYDQDDQGHILRPARWEVPLRWKLDLGAAGALPDGVAPGSLSHRSLIRAGNRLYGHAGRRLLAIELPGAPDASPSVAWWKDLDEEPASLIAADERLFVVTTGGSLLAFGGVRVEPVVFTRPEAASLDPPAADVSRVEQLLQVTQTREGYAVVCGLSDGRMVEALLGETDMHVIAIDPDPQLVDSLRRRLADGPYATRFQTVLDDPSAMELPPYLATLYLSEHPGGAESWTPEQIARVFQTLRPYGGAACFDGSGEGQQQLAKAIEAAALPGAAVEVHGDVLCLRRNGPLPGSADWTHETADAARSFCSRDELVRAPLGVLWYGDGPDHGFYKRKDYGHGVKPQVAGGRLFALQIATNTLHAVDAYTGRLLWTRRVGPSARYASFPDAVYVADGRICDVLDPATGQPRDSFPLDVSRPDDVPVSVTDIRVSGDVILLAVRFNTENSISEGRWNSTLLVALDRSSGRQLWQREAQQRYNTAAIAIGGGAVFAVDSHSPQDITAMRRRGESLEGLPSIILAMDARTGEEQWRTVHNDPPPDLSSLHFMSMRAQDDWLAWSSEQNVLLAGKGDRTYGLDAGTGEAIWARPMRGNQPLIVRAETFINQAGHTYSIRTGELVDGNALFRSGGCNYAVGGQNLLLLRSHCAAYVDLESRRQYNLRNLRSGCSNSLVAADGLLNVPCFSVGCVCNYPIQTSFAMHHFPEAGAWHGTPLRQDVPGKDNAQ